VPRSHRIGIPGRLQADGSELVPVAVGGLTAALPRGVEVVAVCLLHSDLNADHERTVAEHLRAAGFDAVASHEVSPEHREYERTVTTVLDAALRPLCRSYLGRLQPLASEVHVMTSAGGAARLPDVEDHPTRLLLSGPAAGVRAAAAVAAANGFPTAVSFDMGGTSTDVCLLLDGVPEPSAALEVGGRPVRKPSLDIHTIGAGGGSIAWLDDGGALQVGPRSAGAVPGPACYGRGGEEPTFTDADLLLGRLEGVELASLGRPDRDAAERAMRRIGGDPAGVVQVVDHAMAQAVRLVSIERGVDATELALVAFGGAGPLHACAIAGLLGMAAVIVPARAGVLSAVGLLTAPLQVDLVQSWPAPLDHAGLPGARDALAAEAVRQLAAPAGGAVDVATWVDCRYAGQGHELRAADPEHFHAVHERRNGFARPDEPVEVVALRATARAWAESSGATAQDRRPVVGPAVLAEHDCTIWVPPGWSGVPGADGALVLRRA
jgi:N-methylhydantoinase A/oxoprolinase/acetone carboxylase beta subunit